MCDCRETVQQLLEGPTSHFRSSSTASHAPSWGSTRAVVSTPLSVEVRELDQQTLHTYVPLVWNSPGLVVNHVWGAALFEFHLEASFLRRPVKGYNWLHILVDIYENGDTKFLFIYLVLFYWLENICVKFGQKLLLYQLYLYICATCSQARAGAEQRQHAQVTFWRALRCIVAFLPRSFIVIQFCYNYTCLKEVDLKSQALFVVVVIQLFINEKLNCIYILRCIYTILR